MSHEVWRHLAKHPTGRRRWREVGWGKVGEAGEPGVEESRNRTTRATESRECRISSAVGVQLCFDVNSTDWTLSAGGQPLVHAALVEEVHAGQPPAG